MIQVLYESVFLKQRDEHAGADHAQLRVLPAHQGLRAGKVRLIAGDVVLRLEEHLELSFLDGLGKVLDQLLRIHLGLVQRVIKDTDIAGKAVSYGIGGNLGPVEATLKLKGFIHIGIHAHAQPHPVVGVLFPRQAHRGVIQYRLVVLPMRTVDQKDVRLPAADDPTLVMDHLPCLLAHAPQHLVRIGAAIALVDDAEAVDVQHDGVHGRIPVMLVVLFRVAKEEFAVVQASQRITLRGMNDFPSLKQLNGSANSGQDDPMLRIGLLNEIAGARVQALDLLRLIARSHDYGNVLVFRIGLDPAEHLLPLHPRHDQIQNNQ